MSDTTTDFFDNVGGTGGAPSPHLKNVDDFVHGEILEMFKKDFVPFGQKEAEKDDGEADGKRKQLVVILQTEHRGWQNVTKVPKVDPADPNSPEKPADEDDGKRAVYVPNRSNIQYAIGRAVTAAQAKFEVGGTLGVKIANLKDTGKGNPLKEHEARYVAKPVATGNEFFGKAPETSSPPPTNEAPASSAPPTSSAPASQDPWATPSTSSSEPPF